MAEPNYVPVLIDLPLYTNYYTMPPQPTMLVGIVLYAFILIACVVILILSFRGRKVAVNKNLLWLKRIFAALCGLFAIMRISWFCLSFYRTTFGIEMFDFALNRFALCCFFAAFTLIVFFWAEQFHRKYVFTTDFMPTLNRVFVIVNILVWTLQTALVMAAVLKPTTGAIEGNPLYELSIFLILALDLVLGIAFSVYGFRELKQRRQDADISWFSIVKILFVTLVFSACFLLRFALFLYRPITGGYIDPTLFRVFAYFVPEVLPSYLQIVIVYSMKEVEPQYEQDDYDDISFSESEIEPAGDGLGSSRFNTRRSVIVSTYQTITPRSIPITDHQPSFTHSDSEDEVDGRHHVGIVPSSGGMTSVVSPSSPNAYKLH